MRPRRGATPTTDRPFTSTGICSTRLLSAVPERVTGAPPNCASPMASNVLPFLSSAWTISQVGGCSLIPFSGSAFQRITIRSTSLKPSS